MPNSGVGPDILEKARGGDRGDHREFYISPALLKTREMIEIARAADGLGYDGMPDHIASLETLATPYPYVRDRDRRWQPFTD